MPAYSGDSLANVGGALNDYSPVQDATTDLPAAAGNLAMADVVAMTQTVCRAWARFTPAGTGTPVLAASGVQHGELWANVQPSLAAPAPARSTTGVYTMTWPTNVSDEIPSGSPGYTGPKPLNLRAAWADVEGATLWFAQASVTSPNVVTINIFNSGGSLADPNGPTFAVFVT